MAYDFLIVGSGIFGATFARIAADSGKRCLVIEKKAETGGNIRCEDVEGINVHKYGAHIFHTSNEEVWNFARRFVEFNRFTNSPIAVAPDGRLFNLPFNMTTFHQMWGVRTPEEALAKLEEQRRLIKAKLEAEGVSEPRNLEEQALMLVGHDIYKQLIEGYTEKQWGRKCSELPPFIIKRLPLRMTYDNNYFNEDFQGIPIGGYNKLIDGMLDGIEVLTETDFFADRRKWETVAKTILFTGKIDEFFGYCFGKLQYRSVRFDTKVLDIPNYQGNAVFNFTSADIPYTRCIEHKHFEMFGDSVYKNPRTVVSFEYSSEWNENVEAYYPVNDEQNMKLYARYAALAKTSKSVLFGGRLAEYRYYDMAPAMKRAMELAREIAEK